MTLLLLFFLTTLLGKNTIRVYKERYPNGTERERDTESHARDSPTLKANLIKQ